MDNTRIYDEKIDIDIIDVKKFYEVKSSANLLNAVFLNDKLSHNAHSLRNEKEKEILFSFLENKKYKILELGCAAGRWADNLLDKYIEKYDGVDFCSNFIDCAKKKYENYSNIKFYQMQISNLDFDVLDKNYDLIIICGVSMYINDCDLLSIYKNLNRFLNKNGKIYLQESISVINKRLTLKNFYSDELKTNYSAIYRTPEEYNNFMLSMVDNISLVKTGMVLTSETGARKETNSGYFCYLKDN